MRLIKWAALLSSLFCILCITGCLQVNTVIKVRPDGSGTVEETFLMSKDVVQQMSMMVGQMGQMMTSQMGGQAGEITVETTGTSAETGFDIFDQSKLEKRAADFGNETTFLSGEKISNAKFEGYKAIYAFSDINALRINQSPGEAMPEMPGTESKGPGKKKEFVTFDFTKGDPATLTIRNPAKKNDEDNIKPQSDDINVEKNDSMTNEAMPQQMLAMFKDMKVAMSVEVDGAIVETNATHRDGSKVTLMEMDFGKLFEIPEKVEKLSSLKLETLEDAKEFMKDLPGIKVDLNNEVYIKFQKGNAVKAIERHTEHVAPAAKAKSSTAKHETEPQIIEIKMDPKFAKKLYELGNQHFRKRDYASAEHYFKNALKSNPDQPGIHLRLGTVYEKQNKREKAVTMYNESIEIEPDQFEAYFNLAHIYFKQGDNKQAVKLLKNAIDINPGFIDAHILLGVVYQRSGMLNEAIKKQKDALNINKKLAVPHINLGNIHYQNGDYKGALREYKKAVKVDPDMAEAHNNAGNVYLEQGKYNQAINAFKKAIDLKFEYIRAHNNLALAYSKAGMDDEAKRESRIAGNLAEEEVVATVVAVEEIPEPEIKETEVAQTGKKYEDKIEPQAQASDYSGLTETPGQSSASGSKEAALEVCRLLEKSYREGNGQLWLDLKSKDILAQMDYSMKERIVKHFPARPESRFEISSVIAYKKSAAAFGKIIKSKDRSMYHAVKFVLEDAKWKIEHEESGNMPIEPNSFLPPEEAGDTQPGNFWAGVPFAKHRTVDPIFESYAKDWDIQAAIDKSFLYVRLLSKKQLPEIGKRLDDPIKTGAPKMPGIRLLVAGGATKMFNISVGAVASTFAKFDENGRAIENIYSLNYSLSVNDGDNSIIFTCHAKDKNKLLQIGANVVDIKAPVASLGLNDEDVLELIFRASNSPEPDFAAYKPLKLFNKMPVKSTAIEGANIAQEQIDGSEPPAIYLSMDNDIKDRGRHKFQTTLNGAEIRFEDGVKEKAVFMGGNDNWIKIAIDERLAFPNGATMELWFKKADWTDKHWNQTLFRFDSLAIILQKYMRGNDIKLFGASGIFTDNDNKNRSIRSAEYITEEVWTHVAIVYDKGASSITLYENGAESESEKADLGNAQINENYMRPATIGSWRSPSQSFRGWIDEVKIYDYVRTPNQIAFSAGVISAEELMKAMQGQ